MKKLLLSVLLVSLIGMLAACSEEPVEEKESDAPTENAEKEVEETKEKEKDIQEFNQVIVDNENVKATLISVEKIVNKEWNEEKYEVKFEVENKREDTIAVQAREVSADGKMIDESMLVMSQDVSGGKKADAILTIQNFEGELPVIEQNLEMLLHVMSWDDMNFAEDHEVKIEFK